MQDAAKPVAELPFPSVTICSPGLNMKAVEEALLEDFNLWGKENRNTNKGSLENRLDEFMEEKYATTAENILETIKAMNSPPPSSEEETSNRASAVLKHCQRHNGPRVKHLKLELSLQLMVAPLALVPNLATT